MVLYIVMGIAVGLTQTDRYTDAWIDISICLSIWYTIATKVYQERKGNPLSWILPWVTECPTGTSVLF